MRILVVEDTKDMNRLIVKALTKAGYSVDGCYDGEEALDYLAGAEYDGIVLDVMMPKMDGHQLLAKLRAAGSDIPVLFLTARDAVADRVAGLDLGADDYLVKPFAFEELLARIRAMTRKHAGSHTDILTVADLVLDTRGHTAARAGREIQLLPKEYAILEHLMRNQGTVLSREQLEDRIWNYEKAGSSNNIDGYMSRLRKKIDADVPEDERLLHTVRGAGWVLRAPKKGGAA
ncbi:MAG TPA: response regulator transcription factor [Candidatus Fournierella merdavium]|uniref:response regulator transcription factor n=1 Tax=Candidatus Allofournierella merdavium TaxID=2838593 RepID=UPI001F93B9F6|nr:response regulator transcription factor [Candidatus Fournierella merdavium]